MSAKQNVIAQALELNEAERLEVAEALFQSLKAADDAETGTTDVRRVREEIAKQHGGDLAAHVAESNRIADELREKLRLGRVVQPPSRRTPRSGTEG